MANVMAVWDFRGDPTDLAARYNAAVVDVAEMSTARPIIHLAVPREYGLMVCDVWTDEGAMTTFSENPRFREILTEHGMPEPELRVFPVHQLGWPMSVYR